MRQIKNFMEAKRPMWNCNDCKCITMQCWKESEAFCGCGEGGSPLPPLNNAIEATSERSADIFTMDDESLLRVSIETDVETGDPYIEVSPFGVFADERYTIDDHNGRQNILTRFDVEALHWMIESYAEFPSDLFALFDAYYQNPTEANEQAAQEAAGSWVPPVGE